MKTDFLQSGELAKDLGLTEALTIGIGTMIGAGIFILPRYAIDSVGPGAILSYILAGVVCLITAASTAELATGMPKSGGAYFFISRSFGPFIGTISGLSVWLSLTFAVAFYLQGFGEYLALLLPMDGISLALLAGVFFTYVNYVGVKETGRTQNAIVGVLLFILIGYVAWGFTQMDVSLLTPFVPYGGGNILPTTALIFVSFLGFAQIASVAEEISDPGRNIPRAIIGSVAVATVIYVLVLLVTMGLIPHTEIMALDAPLVEAAGRVAGAFGMVALMIAALLATASSANASILASSRINFALGRDRILPEWLNLVHPRYLTPFRPIMMTGIVTLVMIVAADAASLSSSASVLMLLNYALMNLAVIIMRQMRPQGYRPAYLSPGYPYLHLLAAAACFLIIFRAEAFAQVSALALMVVSVGWYALWAMRRTGIESAITDLRQLISAPAWAASGAGFRGLVRKDVRRPHEAGYEHVLTLMANPKHEIALLTVAANAVKAAPGGGQITPIHVLEIPRQVPLDIAETRRELLAERRSVLQEMLRLALEFGKREGIDIKPRILYSRDRFRTISNLIQQNPYSMVVMGWHGSFSMGRIYGSLVKSLVRSAHSPVAVLRDGGLRKTSRILVPYRGSEHALWGVQLATRLAAAGGENRCVTVLRVVAEGADREAEEQHTAAEISSVANDADVPVEAKVVIASRVVQGILEEAEEGRYDLIIMGASKEWLLRNMLFGSIPDIVAEQANTSVLMVRCYDDQVSEDIHRDMNEARESLKEPEKI